MSRWGRFDSNVLAEWIDAPEEQRHVSDKGMRHESHRVMKLWRDFSFFDHSTRINWLAPTGSYIDGASIPPLASFFVAVVGLATLGLLFSPWVLWNPYGGPYRRGSVVHDRACQEKKWPSFVVHRMFSRAARADGAPWHLALVLWMAVRLFGPRFPGRGGVVI